MGKEKDLQDFLSGKGINMSSKAAQEAIHGNDSKQGIPAVERLASAQDREAFKVLRALAQYEKEKEVSKNALDALRTLAVSTDQKVSKEAFEALEGLSADSKLKFGATLRLESILNLGGETHASLALDSLKRIAESDHSAIFSVINCAIHKKGHLGDQAVDFIISFGKSCVKSTLEQNPQDRFETSAYIGSLKEKLKIIIASQFTEEDRKVKASLGLKDIEDLEKKIEEKRQLQREARKRNRDVAASTSVSHSLDTATTTVNRTENAVPSIPQTQNPYLSNIGGSYDSKTSIQELFVNLKVDSSTQAAQAVISNKDSKQGIEIVKFLASTQDRDAFKVLVALAQYKDQEISQGAFKVLFELGSNKDIRVQQNACNALEVLAQHNDQGISIAAFSVIGSLVQITAAQAYRGGFGNLEPLGTKKYPAGLGNLERLGTS